MRKYLFILIFALIQSQCFSQSCIEIDLDKFLATERDPLLSEIASDIEFIKLKTDQDHLIGKIGSISRFNDKLLITTNQGKSLYIFTNQGEFVSEIGRYGKGPGEFLQIYGMSIDPVSNHLYILDNNKSKMMEYSSEGVFIKEKKLSFYATGLHATENGFIFYTGSVYTARSNGCLLTVTDKDFNILSSHHPRSMDKGIPDRLNNLYKIEEDLYYWEPYWDTVYAFNGSTKQAKYSFSMGKKQLPKKLLEKVIMYDTGVDNYRWVLFYKDFKDFLYFNIADLNRRGKRIFYDKNTQEGYCIPGNLDYMDWGFIDDISGGPLFSFFSKLSSDEIVCVFDVIELKEYETKGFIDAERAKNTKRHQELAEILKSSSIEDNPIIAIAKLK